MGYLPWLSSIMGPVPVLWSLSRLRYLKLSPLCLMSWPRLRTFKVCALDRSLETGHSVGSNVRPDANAHALVRSVLCASRLVGATFVTSLVNADTYLIVTENSCLDREPLQCLIMMICVILGLMMISSWRSGITSFEASDEDEDTFVSAARVSTKQCPYLRVVYNGVPAEIFLDSGAESNLISATEVKRLGARIRPNSSKVVCQVDGVTSMGQLGETHLTFIRSFIWMPWWLRN